jgi:hypothetical protein
MENPLSSASIQERAVQMGMPKLSPGAVLVMPVYEELFVSASFPEMDGLIKLKFPSVRDEVLIARDTLGDGGTLEARVMHALQRCCIAAPGSWYSPGNEVDPKPVLDLGQHYDFTGLVNLYTRWMRWRDSFRRSELSTNA